MLNYIIYNKKDEYISDAKEKVLKIILTYIKNKKIKQNAVQELFNIKQPRVSDLANKKLEKFSLDALLMYLYNIDYVIEGCDSENLDEYVKDIKIKLIKSIKKMIDDNGYKQKKLENILSIKQPRVSDLANNKFEKFSIETLLIYIQKFGYEINFNLLDSEKSPISIYFKPTNTNTKENKFVRKYIRHLSVIKKAA